MEKKNIEKGVSLNINYLDFIKRVRDSKLSIELSNREKIVELYNEIVELRFNNLKRVDSRVKREELKEVLSKKLKEIGVSKEEFERVSKSVRDLVKKKGENYIKVEV